MPMEGSGMAVHSRLTSFPLLLVPEVPREDHAELSMAAPEEMETALVPVAEPLVMWELDEQ